MICVLFAVSILSELLPKPVRIEPRIGQIPVCEPTVVREAVEGSPVRVADQAYVLDISSDGGIRISAGGDAGERYARVTLEQLAKLAEGKLPCCRIVDWPALKWRGVMNDCGRNYLALDGVKAFIDVAARYKMNLFHWHLSDYHGWRLESKRYPQLNAPETMMRQIGKFYTQDEFREVVAYAHERGVTVMPELDVPGHTYALRRGLGVKTMKDDGVCGMVAELFDELCSLAPADVMPFVHLGTDEVRAEPEYTRPGWCTAWANTVAAHGRRSVVWAPGEQLNPTGEVVDMVWHDNHVTNTQNRAFDAARMYFAGGKGPELILQQTAFLKPCEWDVSEDRKLGAIACCWHDDNVGDDTTRLFANATVLPAILGFANNYWTGSGKPRGTNLWLQRLPPFGTDDFRQVQDLERRLVAQRDKALADVSFAFPYVAQTEQHWRISWADGRVIDPDYVGGLVDVCAFVTNKTGHAVAETWVKVPSNGVYSAWIGFTNTGGCYSRQYDEPTPKQGEWSKYGSSIEVNGVKVPPPVWDHPGARADMTKLEPDGKTYKGAVYSNDLSETPLGNDFYYCREPSRVELREGWNYVKLDLPKPTNVWGRCWRGVFRLLDGTTSHPREVEGVEFSSRNELAGRVSGRFVATHTEKVELKGGWRFVKADDPKIGTNYDFRAMSIVLDRADRGDLSGAPETDWAKPGFDDGAWKTVQVPHDWGIESTYDPSRRYGDAFLDVVGVGWYRRALDIPEDWKGKKIYFECDGAMSYAHVWINGRFVGGWPYGYTRFRLDLTPHLDFKGANTLAIRCHNVIDSSRWYTGGGLYRNCRLLVCPEDHVVPGSVRITTPEITVKRAKVRVCYEMSISGRREFSFEVENPRLWDIDDPYLYEVAVEGDTYRYGIRTIAFHADERRFQLNGRTVPLNGVSMHHDFGVLGAAWNRTAQKRRLLLFKDAGVNAIRSSHNPPDEGLLELCDELGLLVKDEVFDEWKCLGRLNGSTGDGSKRVNGYTNLFDIWHERDLRAWIRTDRNHPSVIMYSLGNEIPDGKHYIVPTSEYVARSRELARIAASEDSTRPTTAANNNVANYTNDYPMTLALMGCNYFSWQYPELKRRYPDVPFFGTETICMSSTRGEYTFPVAQAWPRKDEWTELVNSSYCWQAAGWSKLNAGWACPPDVQWYWMDKVGTCMGEFVWTGVDYLGGPYWCDEVRTRLNRPGDGIHTCNTGFLDRAGFRKDAFWLFQSRWRPDLPMAHILPHWNWAGREGLVTPVYVFTSGDEGELFLNGQSLGRQRKHPGIWDRAYRLRWDDVRYTPGNLEVVTYKNGREWARDTVVTAGQVAQLGIEPEVDSIVSDGEDIAYVNVCVKDKNGNVVPRTRNLVKFSVEGPGIVLATDNGYEADMSDFHASEHRVFNGWVQALVRANPGAKGLLTVTAVSDGLDPVKAKIAVCVKER